MQLRAELGAHLAERHERTQQQSARHQRTECEVLERLESAARSSAHTLENARREATALAQQHQRLTQASAAAAEASAASLAAARTEIEQLRAEIKHHQSHALLAKQECESWKDYSVNAEWMWRHAEQAAAATLLHTQEKARRQQQTLEGLELELARSKQQSAERQEALESTQAQLQEVRRALADVLEKAGFHQFLSTECENSMGNLLAGNGGGAPKGEEDAQNGEAAGIVEDEEDAVNGKATGLSLSGIDGNLFD